MLKKFFIPVLSLFLILGILYYLLLVWIFFPEKSNIYVDTKQFTKQDDHFLFEEYSRGFPQPKYDYVIYDCDNSKKHSVYESNNSKEIGYLSSDTQITKDDIFSHTHYTEYTYKNKKVKIYSNTNNSKLIFKTSQDKNFSFSQNDSFAHDLNYKSPDVKKVYNSYNCLVPFYRKLLRYNNKNAFLISSVFLIFMDDIQSFPTISENIKLIVPKKQHYFLDYINHYPSCKKDKYIITQQIDPYWFRDMKF